MNPNGPIALGLGNDQRSLVGLRDNKVEFGLLLLAVLVCTGCGGAPSSVSGTVTLDGKPLAGSESTRATVMFYPVSSGAPAAALTDANGKYTLATGSQAGLNPGTYAVVISATESKPPSDQGQAPPKRLITPEKYADPERSGFRVDVELGRNVFDFELVSEE